MNERSYHQYCPIAHALDLVGDRWALLVVRDLFLGPKRYTDLRGSLPGIGSNILAARLKELEGAGVVQRRVLPPPAASTVYELTPYGRRLEGVIVALSRWGAESLGRREADQVVNVESVMLAGRALFVALSPNLGRVQAELRVEDTSFSGVFGVEVDPPQVEISREPLDHPVLVLRTDTETLFSLAAGRVTVGEALAQGQTTLDGALEVVARMSECVEAR